MTHPGGRPRKYKSPEEMQIAIDDYFATCDKENKPYLITGLALHLGFTSRTDLINYEGYSLEFHNTIKKAKTRVEAYCESKIFNHNPAGAIFALKNYGWKDRQEIDVNADVDAQISVKFVQDEDEE